MTLYMAVDEEQCWPLDHFQPGAMSEGPIDVYECKRDIGGEMWCKVEGDFVDTVDCCGNICSAYAPCNGKSGRCRRLVNGYVKTGKKFRVIPDGALVDITRRNP